MDNASPNWAGTTAIVSELRQLVCTHFHIELSAEETSLAGHGGSFDSVSLVQLIVLVEEHFGVQFEEDELRMEVFGDLKSLAALIRQKTACPPG
jgi:acyl carrier protein